MFVKNLTSAKTKASAQLVALGGCSSLLGWQFSNASASNKARLILRDGITWSVT